MSTTGRLGLRPLAVIGLAFGLCEFFSACEWQGTSDSDSWNDSYNWVNFSGVYRGVSGGTLVTDYTAATPGTAGATYTVNNQVVGSTGGGNTRTETYDVKAGTTVVPIALGVSIIPGSITIIAGGFTLTDPTGSGILTESTATASGVINYSTGAGSLNLGIAVVPSVSISYAVQTPTLSGSLGHSSIVKGSVTINAGGVFFQDDGNGLLTGSIGSGTIEYGTGTWSVNLGSTPVPNLSQITASYQYTVAGTTGSGGAGPGSTGAAINSFTVFQQGNLLTITDNNGKEYEGKMGSVSTTSGFQGSTTSSGQTVPASGDTIIAQFTAEGVSAAGLTVKMVGTLQAVVSGGQSSSGTSTTGSTTTGTQTFSLTSRQIFGTWIENGGQTGDINGQSSPVSVSVSGVSTNGL